jgi:hypothetical protein
MSKLMVPEPVVLVGSNGSQKGAMIAVGRLEGLSLVGKFSGRLGQLLTAPE